MASLPNNLRYSCPDDPGLSRRKRGPGFSYYDDAGQLVTCETTLLRIRSLGLPPAYKDVWICADAQGHLQAVGTDVRGRRQYRYHAEWQAFRQQQKFDRLVDFGRALPRIRHSVSRDLRRNQADKALVCAALVRLIDQASLRVGSERYVQENGSFGATTLRSRHLKLSHNTLILSCRAKGGRRVRKQIQDRTLARVLNQIDDLPGRLLFQSIDDQGSVKPVLSEDVNAYLSEVAEDNQSTAKTFRTWQGSVCALDEAFSERGILSIKQMSESAAAHLHNTPSIARHSYIHPKIIELAKYAPENRTGKLEALDLRRAPNGLSQDEKRLIVFLKES